MVDHVTTCIEHSVFTAFRNFTNSTNNWNSYDPERLQFVILIFLSLLLSFDLLMMIELSMIFTCVSASHQTGFDTRSFLLRIKAETRSLQANAGHRIGGLI